MPYLVTDILIPALIIVAIVYSFYLSGKRKKALVELSKHYHGSVSNKLLVPSLDAEYEGSRFNITLNPGRKNSPRHLEITFYKDSPFKLSITKESGLSRLSKKLGLVHEVKIGDESFDREFLIRSSDPDPAKGYLYSSDKKEAIRSLFNEGFDSFLIESNKVSIEKPDYKDDPDLTIQKISVFLRKLSALAQ